MLRAPADYWSRVIRKRFSSGRWNGAIRNTNFYELAIVAPGAANPVPPVFENYSDQLEDVGADGCYPVPDGPGLGVTLNWDFIRSRTVTTQVFE